MEMESQFHAKLFDYTWLEQLAKNELGARVLLKIANKIGLWSEMLSLRAVWSLRKFDVIYATGEDVGLPLAVLLRILDFERPYFILRAEQPIFGRNEFRQKIYKSIMQFAVTRIDVIMTRTQAHANYFNNYFRLKKTTVFFSPETTDTKFFNMNNDAIHLDVLKNIPRPYIVSAGLEMRDYATLIEAVEGLPVTALICAGSPWAKVRFNSVNSALPENVLVNSFSQLEMREIYRSAEFVVLPIYPTMRACGMNVILEAWAMGKAVIASQTEGLMSYINDGIDGLFVSLENVKELRSSILHLLNSPEEVKRLGVNGQDRVNRELGMERYLETVWREISQASKLEV